MGARGLFVVEDPDGVRRWGEVDDAIVGGVLVRILMGGNR